MLLIALIWNISEKTWTFRSVQELFCWVYVTYSGELGNMELQQQVPHSVGINSVHRLSLSDTIRALLSCRTSMWKSRKISFTVKLKLYNTLVLSILLYDCERWASVAESEWRLQAFEMKCFRRLLGISYREHKTNEYFCQQIISLKGQYEPLLTTVNWKGENFTGLDT